MNDRRPNTSDYEESNHLFEAFGVWKEKEDDNLLGQKGTSYYAEAERKRTKSIFKRKVKVIVTIIFTFMIAAYMVSTMVLNRTDESGSSGGTGTQIAPASEASSLRGKDKSFSQNPYVLGEETQSEKQIQNSFLSEKRQKDAQKYRTINNVAFDTSKQNQETSESTTPPSELPTTESEIKKALKDAVSDMEVTKEIKLEEDEKKIFSNTNNTFTRMKDKIRTDISNAVHYILNKNSSMYNDMSDEVVDEKINDMQDEAVYLFEKEELDKFEKDVDAFVDKKEAEVEKIIGIKDKGDSDSDSLIPEKDIVNDIEILKTIAEDDIKMKVDQVEQEMEKSFESDARNVEKDMIREKFGVVVTDDIFNSDGKGNTFKNKGGKKEDDNGEESVEEENNRDSKNKKDDENVDSVQEKKTNKKANDSDNEDSKANKKSSGQGDDNDEYFEDDDDYDINHEYEWEKGNKKGTKYKNAEDATGNVKVNSNGQKSGTNKQANEQSSENDSKKNKNSFENDDGYVDDFDDEVYNFFEEKYGWKGKEQNKENGSNEEDTSGKTDGNKDETGSQNNGNDANIKSNIKDVASESKEATITNIAADNTIENTGVQYKKRINKVNDEACQLYDNSTESDQTKFKGIGWKKMKKLNSKNPFSLAILDNNDVLSGSIMDGSLERGRIWGFNQAIRRHSKNNNKTISDLKLIDIGAGIGWFTMNMAAFGVQVLAFEPMEKNSDMILRSLCMQENIDSGVSSRVSFYNIGLGEKEDTCFIFSDDIDVGSGNVDCDGDEKKSSISWPDQSFHGTIKMKRLDDLIPEAERTDIVAVKMAAEGFEHNIIKGGKEVLLGSKIPYIETEFSPSSIRAHGGDPSTFIESFYDAGYSLLKDDDISYKSRYEAMKFGDNDPVKDITFVYTRN